MPDRTAFPKLLRKAKRIALTIALFGWTRATGSAVAAAAAKAGVTIDLVSGRNPVGGSSSNRAGGSSNAPNGWINHCRRLDRHYEVTLDAHEGFLILSQIALRLSRLDRSQLFDTL